MKIWSLILEVSLVEECNPRENGVLIGLINSFSIIHLYYFIQIYVNIYTINCINVYNNINCLSIGVLTRVII